MFITVDTPEGAEATINTAFVTHVTQLESAYPEAGSCVHFTSERALQINMTVSQFSRMLASGTGNEAMAKDEPLVRPA